MNNVRVAAALLLCAALTGPLAVARERGLVERVKDRARTTAPKAKALANKAMNKVIRVAEKGAEDPTVQALGAKARAAMASLAELARSRGATRSPAKASEWWEAEGRGVVKGQVSRMLSGSSEETPASSGESAAATPPVLTRSGTWVAPQAAAPAASAAAPPPQQVSGFSSLSRDAIAGMPEASGAAAPAAAPASPAPAGGSSFSKLVGDSIGPAQPGSSVPQPVRTSAATSPEAKPPPGSTQISGFPQTTKPAAGSSPAPTAPEPVWTAASGSSGQQVLTGQSELLSGPGAGQIHVLSSSRGRKSKTAASPKPPVAAPAGSRR